MTLVVNQLIGFGAFTDASGGTETLVDRTTGTIFGDMTTGGDFRSALYDGTTNQALGGGAGPCPYKTGTSGYVGKSYSAGKKFSKAIVYGPNDDGFVYASNPSVTLTVYGKNGSNPANSTDGTSIGSLTFTDTGNESAGRTITSTDTVTAYDRIWVTVSGAGSQSYSMAEIVLYELL
jgi:hypothetical protein